MKTYSPNTSIFLIGPMGAGKSTIGLALAKQLGRQFYDSDKEIETRTGATIPLIFELEGEAGFRKRESAVIDDLSARNDIVLATGGGAVLNAQNRAHLRGRGLVVYLKADLDHLLARTSKDNHRPLLRTADPRQTLATLLAEREPLYLEVADLTVDTSERSIPRIVQLVVEQLEPGRH